MPFQERGVARDENIDRYPYYSAKFGVFNLTFHVLSADFNETVEFGMEFVDNFVWKQVLG